MIKIPKKLTKTIGKHHITYKHYELVKVYPHFVAYKCIENGQIENFTKNDFYTKEEEDMSDKINQAEKIIEYLKNHKDITSFEAYDKLKITQFGARIEELEKQGYCFKKVWDYNINLAGEKKKFKRYSLERVNV